MTVPTPPLPTPPDPTPPVPTPPPAKTFSQADVDRFTAEARDRGARSAQTALLTELGITDAASAKQLLADAQAARDAQLTEQQRATAAADAARVAAEQTTAANQQQAHALRIERALYSAGVSPVLPDGTPNPAVALAARLVDAAPTADDAAVTAAVAAVKVAVPVWFAPPAPLPGTDPGRGPLPGQIPGAGTSLEEMRAIASRVHGTTPSTAS